MGDYPQGAAAHPLTCYQTPHLCGGVTLKQHHVFITRGSAPNAVGCVRSKPAPLSLSSLWHTHLGAKATIPLPPKHSRTPPPGLCKRAHPLGSYAAGSAEWSRLITPPKTSIIILESYSRILRAERYAKHLGRAALAVEGSVQARGSGWGQGNGRNVEDQM